MPRCHKIEAVNEEGYIVATRYAGTTMLARAVRDELVTRFGLRKKDVTIEKAEIPHQKDELIEFVNGILAESDAAEDDADGADNDADEDE